MTIQFNKILVALPQDDAEAGHLGELGLQFAQTHSAQVRLISVLSPDIPVMPTGIGLAAVDVVAPKPAMLSKDAIKNREQLLDNIILASSDRDRASTCVRVGNPTEHIVEEAAEWAADLIVLGARDRNWLERMFEASVSQTVAKRAECSVLIVPDRVRHE